MSRFSFKEELKMLSSVTGVYRCYLCGQGFSVRAGNRSSIILHALVSGYFSEIAS